MNEYPTHDMWIKNINLIANITWDELIKKDCDYKIKYDPTYLSLLINLAYGYTYLST
jgi:hypothetical protein